MNNIKVNSQSGQDGSSTDRTEKTRNVPRGDKSFRKLLGDREQSDNDDDNELVDIRSAESARNARMASANQEVPKQKKPSLFDLSKNSIKDDADSETKDVVNMASSDELMNSPTTLYKNLALKEKAAKSKPQEGMLESANVKFGQEDKKQSPLQESPNLAYVNPSALQAPTLSETANRNLETALPSQKMSVQQLVDVIVKAITTIDSQGKTDTVVTLKEPPMFAGSQVVLTSYETAKGEFNIRFENLSQDAKSFMDMQQNQQSLFSALNEKGYMVHIMVATTQTETAQFTAAAPEQSQQQQGQSDSEDQQQPRKRGQQADEGQA